MDRSTRTDHARSLFAGVAREYDFMSELLSYGQNARWRRFLVSRVTPVGGAARVLDVATGTAGVAREIARRDPAASIVGVDQSEPMLGVGRRGLDDAAVGDRITLVAGQAEQLPFPDGAFDAVTFTYLLRYVDDPAGVVAELARVLRPGGILACLEFFVPTSPVWRAGWNVQTKLALPVLGRLASAEWYEAGRFLSRSIPEFYARYPLTEQGRWWRDAQIERPRYRPMTLGAAVVIWGRKQRD